MSQFVNSRGLGLRRDKSEAVLRRASLSLVLVLVVVLFAPAWVGQEKLNGVSALSSGRTYDFSSKSIDAYIQDLMVEFNMNEYNFSYFFRNVETGEEHKFNEEYLMVPGSTYKLPLNMYYYEMEAEGVYASDMYIPGSGGCNLDTAHYLSIVESNNEVSIAMQNYLNGFYGYKREMARYFTSYEESGEEVPEDYFWCNRYNARMMMDILQYLYDRSDFFEELIGYMEVAKPDEYFKKYAGDTVIAHKYGCTVEDERAENDVGIIYGAQDFLLVVYTSRLTPEISALICEMFISYVDYTYNRDLAAAMLAESESISISVSQSISESSYLESSMISASVSESISSHNESVSVAASISVHNSEVESRHEQANKILKLEKRRTAVKNALIALAFICPIALILFAIFMRKRAK